MQLGILAEETTGLTVQPYWVLVAIVQFLILFFLLQRFLWGPIQKTLQARADRIREGLEAAEAAKRDRTQMKAEIEKLLTEARREAAAIAERACVVGFDLVEVNPMIDNAAQLTSFVGVQLIVEFLARIVEHPGYRQRHPMQPSKPS